MGENGGRAQQQPKSSTLSEPSRPTMVPPRPSITLPPKTSIESLFNGGSLAGAGFGFSPGPMTLVSNFFADNNDDCKSFSQLLSGAMGSPVTVPASRGGPPSPLDNSSSATASNSGFKQSRPQGLTIASSPVFTIPPGFSPAGLLDSPGLFLPGQGSFGMTHRQALAQVTAQAAQAHSHLHVQAEYSSVSSAPANSAIQLSVSNSDKTSQKMPPLIADSGGAVKELSNHANSDQRLHSSSLVVDKPADDGYNWRKYGQKQVKGSEFPRSYYKCTHPNCPVKKKVERSLDGQVTAIIYKGQHNHEPPVSNKRGRDAGNVNEDSNLHGNFDVKGEIQSGNGNRIREGMVPYSQKEQESSQATAEHLSGTSDSEEVENAEGRMDEKDDEPQAKRRNTEVRVPEPASSHRTVTEPRIIVQTTSEVDLLDDGYRWRKYGQKVVKGNPYPRSYYKCTSQGCNVRKHVERASTDPKAVITTYEGKHNHDVPAARNSSHNTANNSAPQLRPHNSGTEKQMFNNKDPGNNDQRPVARLRLKEEQIT